MNLPPPESPELYDLSTDPGEGNDLAAEFPARVSDMLGQLETWFEEVEAERRTISDIKK